MLAVLDSGSPIAFAQLIQIGHDAEITHVFVHPDHRGRGIGSALTSAAIAHARDARRLFICADEEDRPKELYRRLGFAGVFTEVQFLRLPG